MKLPIAFVLLGACLLFCPRPGTARNKHPEREPFDRAQIMLINLNHGETSTGAYLSRSLQQIKQIRKELDKAQSQLEQVDRVYSKSRGRAGESFLAGPDEHLKQVRETCQKMEDELKEASDDLKSTIQQTLVTQENR